MKVNFCLNAQKYEYSTKTAHISLEEQAKFNFIDLEEKVWKNPNLQSEFKISATYKQFLRDEQKGIEWEQFMTLTNPPATQTPFKNALSAKQPATTEKAYNEATSRLLSLMEELGTLAVNEQGVRSEIGYMLADSYNSFNLGVNQNYDWLQLIKQALKNSENTAEDIVFAVDTYFSRGALTPQEFINLFDYISDKFEGLPMEQIMQDLSTIKGWWDNNSEERLTLDDGTKIGFTQSFDNNGNVTYTTLFITLPNGVEMKFDAVNLEAKNSQILFKMFKQRENLQSKDEKSNKVNLNKNSKVNLNLNNTNLNRNANAINLHLNLNEFFNTKTNSNKHSNSNDNLLKALLQGVASDESEFRNLKA